MGRCEMIAALREVVVRETRTLAAAQGRRRRVEEREVGEVERARRSGHGSAHMAGRRLDEASESGTNRARARKGGRTDERRGA